MFGKMALAVSPTQLPNVLALSGRETNAQTNPPSRPRSASTPGWTTRAPSHAHPGYGVYIGPGCLEPALTPGGATGTAHRMSHDGRMGGLLRPSKLSPYRCAGTAGHTTPPTGSGARRPRGSCHALPKHRDGGGPTGAWNHTAADQATTTHRTPFGMVFPPLAASRLPIKHCCPHHRALP
jgi:hypothetical protein